jgi:lipopolysaccharide assembly outer membrane protein LptD (OstA)
MESCRLLPVLSRALAAFCLAATLLAGGLLSQEPVSAKPQAKPTAKPAAEPTPAPSPEVKILARSQERIGERVYAAGDVEIRYGEFLLFADRVEYDLETKDVMAEGNVVVQSGAEVIRAERVLYNLESGRATIDRASGLLPPSVLFEAESLERKQNDLYALKKARLTACTQPNPRWSFSLSKANLKTGDSIEMWDAVLRIKSVPVLYLPYLRYPLKERATGFLMPQIGYAGEKGFAISQSFYWAMASNMDATVGVDFYLARGTGAGLEYRYLFPGGTKGDLNLYYFIYKKQADGTKPGSSSIIRLNHTQALPLGFTLAANVDYQTSFTFLREFDNNFQRALSFTRTSQVFLSRSWQHFNLSARASRFETYFSQLDDSNVSTSLPQISFNVFKTRLFAPVYFSLATTISRTQYGWKSEYAAGTERRSSRLGVSPSLSLPFSSIPWLTATTTVTANLNYYGQSLDPDTGGIVDEPIYTRNFVAAVEIVGPVFFRVFYGRDGRARLKNIIEPYVNYSYDSPTNAASRIVTNFGFFRYHQMSYGVTGRFLFRGEGDRSVEVFSLALGQTYYFSPADGPLSLFPVDGKPPRFSEVTGTLRFYPQAKFSLDASAAYNPYYKNLSSLRLSATAGDKPAGDFLTVSWFTSRNSWITGVDPQLIALYNRDQIGAFAGLRLPALDIDLQLEADYNIKDRKLLYTGAQLTYHYQCVDILVDVRAFYFRARSDTQVRVSLGLGSIGKTLDFLGGFGF